MWLMLLCSYFLMERIQKEHCRLLPYNLTELCSDQKFYLAFEGGGRHITTLKLPCF